MAFNIFASAYMRAGLNERHPPTEPETRKRVAISHRDNDLELAMDIIMFALSSFLVFSARSSGYSPPQYPTSAISVSPLA